MILTLLGTAPAASLGVTVGVIVDACTEEEMPYVDAGRPITVMQDAHSSRNIASRDHPANSVGLPRLVGEPHRTITISVRGAGPDQAIPLLSALGEKKFAHRREKFCAHFGTVALPLNTMELPDSDLGASCFISKDAPQDSPSGPQ